MQISFAAVNCFHHHGQCRKSYKTHTYPVIVAFIGQQSLMYTGLLASDYIYRLEIEISSLIFSFIHFPQNALQFS